MIQYVFLKIIDIAIFTYLVAILSLLFTGGYSFYLGPLKIAFIDFLNPIRTLFCLIILKLLFDPQIDIFFSRKGFGIDLRGQKIDLQEQLEADRFTYLKSFLGSLIKKGFQGLQKTCYNFYSQQKGNILKTLNILGIFGLFIFLTAIMTYPLILNLESNLPDNLGEPLLNTWILDWDVHQILTDPLNLFNANIFYPHKNVLAYSEHLVGNSLLAMPIILLTGNVILAYNFVFLFSFFVSAFAMYLLVKYLTGHAWSAFISALIFAFCPFRFAHLSHLQVLTAQWLPLIFLYLHKYMNEARYRYLIWLTIFYILQALSCGYTTLFATLFMAIFLLINIKRGSFGWRNLLRLTLLILVTTTLLFPFIYPYLEVKRDWGFHRSREEVILFSAHLNGYFRVPEGNKAYQAILSDPTNNVENTLFPGYACLFLATLSIAWAIVNHRQHKVNKVYRSLQNTKDDENSPLPPLGEGRIGGLTAFYILMGVLAFSLSLGPLIHLSRSVSFWGPYNLLYDLAPGFDALRAPARLGLFVIFALAILAGFGARFIFEITGPLKKPLIFLMFTLLILMEYYSAPIPTATIETGKETAPVYKWLANQKGDFAIIELPLTDIWQETLYTFYSIYHKKSLVNGQSGYYPPLYYFYLKDRAGLFPALDFIRDLQALRVKYLVWHSHLYPQEQREQIKSQIAGLGNTLQLVRQFYTDYVFAIDPGPFPTPPDSYVLLDRTEWHVETNRFNTDSPKAIDGILETYWSTQEPQKPGSYFLVDLGKEHQINGIRVHLGQDVAEYPRGYTIEISADKKVWEFVQEKKAPLPPLLSYARQPKDPIFEIYFPPRKTHYIKITLLGTHHQYRWTIHEIAVLSPLKNRPAKE